MFSSLGTPPGAPQPAGPQYGAPANSILNGQVNQASIALNNQTTYDQLDELGTQTRMAILQTATTNRQSISAAMETEAQQAESLEEQVVGDEVAQAKKGLENAGKAV